MISQAVMEIEKLYIIHIMAKIALKYLVTQFWPNILTLKNPKNEDTRRVISPLINVHICCNKN